MKVISLNANGIRAASRKGFFDWMAATQPDVVCIQETKAQVHQLTDPMFHPQGYYCQYVDAEKKGYSGVAMYSRYKPDKVITKIGFDEFDREGRYVEMQFGKLNIASLYLPSGSHNDLRQEAKFRFLDLYMPRLKEMRGKRRDYILCGDWNIAHKEIDLKNWKANRKNSGFLPEEREWMDVLFEKTGYVDAFRVVNEQPDQYTWWSNRGRAWDNNVGWRIDYHVVTPGLKDKVVSADIYKDERFSDHAPLIIDYEME